MNTEHTISTISYLHERIEKLELKNIDHQIKRIANLECSMLECSNIINTAVSEQNKLEELENETGCQRDNLNLALDRICELERFRKDSINCHHKIEELEERIDHLDDEIVGTDGNVSDLIKDVFDTQESNEELKKRIKVLEDFIGQNYKKDIEEINARFNMLQCRPFVNDKKPHKCPICDGEGSWSLNSIEDMLANNGCSKKRCSPCEGKGIVWG